MNKQTSKKGLNVAIQLLKSIQYSCPKIIASLTGKQLRRQMTLITIRKDFFCSRNYFTCDSSACKWLQCVLVTDIVAQIYIKNNEISTVTSFTTQIGNVVIHGHMCNSIKQHIPYNAKSFAVEKFCNYTNCQQFVEKLSQLVSDGVQCGCPL